MTALRELVNEIGFRIDLGGLSRAERLGDRISNNIADSFRDMGADIDRTFDNIDNTIRGIRDPSIDTSDLRNELSRAGMEVDELCQEIQRTEQQFSSSTDRMERDAFSLRGELKDLAGALGGGVVGDIIGDDITSFAQLPREFQAQLGVSEGIANNLKNITKEIWTEIPGISKEGAAEATATAFRYFDATGSRAHELGKDIALLNRQSGVEMYRLGQDAKLMDERFADIKSPEQAFNILAKASQKLPADMFDELLDMTEEYGGNLAGVGLTANDFFSAMIEGGERSRYVMDRLGDTLANEMVASIKKNDEGVLGALGELGGSASQASEWRSALVNGGEEGKVAVREILTELSTMTDKEEQAALGAQIFGEMFTEQAAELMPLYKKLGEGYKDLGGNATDLEVVNEGMLNKLKSGWLGLRADIDDITGGIAGDFAELAGNAMPYIGAFLFGGGLGKLKKLGKLKVFGKPLGELVSGFGRLATTIGSKGITSVSRFIGGLDRLIFNVGSKALPMLGRFALGIGRFLTGPIGAAVITVGTLGYTIYTHWDQISEKTGQLKDSVVLFFSNMASGIRDRVNLIIADVNNLINRLNSINITVPDWVPLIGGKSWSPNIGHIGSVGTRTYLHAAGGIFGSPHFGVVAEAGREAIIPLDQYRDRAIGLWAETGRQLGVGGYTGGLRPMAMENNAPIFSPQITVYYSGSGGEQEVQRVAKIFDQRMRASFHHMMEEYWRTMARKRPALIER